MMRHIAAILALFPAQAIAHDLICFDRTSLIAQQADRYGERQLVRAMEERGRMLEVYVGEGGSWTMLIVTPDLQACIVATGQQWMMVPPGIAG
jgi:hypothetical protein